MEPIKLWFLTLFLTSAGLFFLILPILIAIKDKKTRLIEDALDDGNRFYSLNIITAGSGALHYGSIFLFDWYARRYKVIEKRKEVPKNLQVWFKLYYILFIIFSSMFLLACIIAYLGLD
ncbi:hypothetical protein P4S63_14885 [Pseudoalteromonas sp. B193]